LLYLKRKTDQYLNRIMKKVYYLGTCDTCARIIKDLKLKEKDFKFQDIKTEKITKEQLEEMKALAGSYESLFSRVALKYKTLDPKPATESEYKKLILQEYTFLKRPVIINGKHIYIGNSKGNVQKAKEELK
jgi:arsenate reductase (glutaredoxin)